MIQRWLVACFIVGVCAGIEVYVAVDGSDSSGDGSAAAPFASVQRALLAARNNNTISTIALSSGTFYLPNTSPTPIKLGSADARPPSAPLTITSALLDPVKQAVVSGGIPIKDWTQSTDNQQLWYAHVPENVLYFRQLFANGVRQQLARSKTFSYKSADSSGFYAEPEQLVGLPSTYDDIHAVMYESWTASLHLIDSVDSSGFVKLKTTYNNKWSGSAAGSRYYFENYMAGLDYPSEFYFNSSTRIVWWYPPSFIPDPNQADVIAPQLKTVFDIGDGNGTVTNIYITNMRIEHTAVETEPCFHTSCDEQSAAFLETATIHVQNASHIHLQSLNITNVGGYAVWFNKGTTNSSITRSYLANLGAGGVRVGVNLRDRVARSLLTRHIAVVDNFIESGGQYYQEGCGVLAQATAYTDISHNLIQNFSYTGISLGWTWGYAATSNVANTITYNRIDNMGKSKLSDMGCIYTLGNNPDSNVTHNVCSQVMSYNYGGWGLYTDEGSRGFTFSDNIVYFTKCAGLHQHYGLDNTFKNNVFANVNLFNADAAIRSSPSSGTCDQSAPAKSCTSFDFNTNIVYVRDGALFYETTTVGFKNTTFDRNVYWSIDNHTDVSFPNDTTFKQWQGQGQDKLSTVADPLFTNPEMNDYSHFQSSSPALKLGFAPINVTGVGPSWVPLHVMHNLPSHIKPFVIN